MKICEHDKCNNIFYSKGYCIKHYKQLKKYGRVLKRTRLEGNEILTNDLYTEIIMYNNLGEEKARAKIDTEDVEKYKISNGVLMDMDMFVGDFLTHHYIDF